MTEGAPSGMSPVLKVVLIVGGILGVSVCGAGVAGIFLVSKVAKKAQAAVTTLQLSNIDSAIQTYRLSHHALPPTLDALIPEYLEPAEGSGGVITDGWGNAFLYEPAEDGESFRLMSYGADGVEGGAGNDADIRLVDVRER